MKNSMSSIIVGILFIITGGLIFMDRLGLISFSWYEAYPLIMIGFGILLFVNVFRGKKDSAFWATVFLLLGGFFCLRNYDLIDYFWFGHAWPAILFSLGMGFIVQFIFKPNDWGLLIPGGLLTFFGGVQLMEAFDLPWRTIDKIRDFWPLVLVIVGLGLISSSIFRARTSQKSRV